MRHIPFKFLQILMSVQPTITHVMSTLFVTTQVDPIDVLAGQVTLCVVLSCLSCFRSLCFTLGRFVIGSGLVNLR